MGRHVGSGRRYDGLHLHRDGNYMSGPGLQPSGLRTTTRTWDGIYGWDGFLLRAAAMFPDLST